MVESTLTQFFKALRGADVRVSTSESLDAIRAVDLVGYENRSQLKTSLGVVLAKTEQEKQAFDRCFDEFFQFKGFQNQSDQQSTEEKLQNAERNAQSQSDAAQTQKPDSSSINDSRQNQPNDGAQQGQANGSGGGGGGQSQGNQSGQAGQVSSQLGKLLLEGDRNQLAMALAKAGKQSGIEQITVMTQKGLYGRQIMKSMGLDELEEEMWSLEKSEDTDQQRLGKALRDARQALREEVKAYVQQQFLLHAQEARKQLREEVMRSTSLEYMREFKEVELLVQKIAKRLIAQHSRRKKVTQRGQLDLRGTLRKNLAYDGLIVEPKWRSKRIDRPKVMALCDVSGSVSNVSRFLMMFLYSLTDILPNVRAFAFANRLGEVTELFKALDLQQAGSVAIDTYRGSTDYGHSLQCFKDLCLNDVDNKTTVMILGDARNNYGDPRTDIMKAIYDRSKQVIWLNPEPRVRWNTGDSVMRQYTPYCTFAEVCYTLNHLERVVGKLMKVN